jgi:hypothetical protein
MERSLSPGTRDIRSVLILCLLTIRFESWNGDIQSGPGQVRVGLSLSGNGRRPCLVPNFLPAENFSSHSTALTMRALCSSTKSRYQLYPPLPQASQQFYDLVGSEDAVRSTASSVFSLNCGRLCLGFTVLGGGISSTWMQTYTGTPLR